MNFESFSNFSHRFTRKFFFLLSVMEKFNGTRYLRVEKDASIILLPVRHAATGGCASSEQFYYHGKLRFLSLQMANVK